MHTAIFSKTKYLKTLKMTVKTEKEIQFEVSKVKEELNILKTENEELSNKLKNLIHSKIAIQQIKKLNNLKNMRITMIFLNVQTVKRNLMRTEN